MASCQESNTIFKLLNSSATNIFFKNNLPDKKGFNILYYLYYYAGGGVATGDINNDGMPDIYFTANSMANNKLYLNKGNMQFEDITAKAGTAGTSDWCTGVTMADIDADGWLDIYVCAVSGKFGLTGHNQLFINNHDGTFTDKASEYGLDMKCYSAQAVFFDYDHDGDLDCYLLNESDRPNQNIVDTSHRRQYDAHAGDRLLRNDLNLRKKKFMDVSAQSGIYQSNLGYGLGLAVADLNNDGWEDIYIGNDFHENDYYYINNKNGTFSESSAKHFKHYSRFSMGNDIADYNNDGQLDVITVDMLPPNEEIVKTYGSDENADIYTFKVIKNGFQYQYSKNCLQRNNGDGNSFSETSLVSGVAATDWSWCPLFADFDNDGNKDLFITSGILKRTTDLDYVRFISNAFVQKKMNSSADLDDEAISKMPDGISHSFIYKGDGSLIFQDKSKDWGLEKYKGYFTGAAYADLDNDGDLDLVVNAINSTAQVFKNIAPKKNYLSISFKGDSLNTSGIGAKAYIFSKDKMQYQQLMCTRGFQSASEPRLHFGLNDAASADSVLIVWPNQQYQLIKHVLSNQQINVEQKNATDRFEYKLFFAPANHPLVNISDSIHCNWTHKENDFVDFNRQYLIPHVESTRGPKIAVADFNKDGAEDFFVAGAKGQPGCLMKQTKNGVFVPSDTMLFKQHALFEDVDAVFFDANNDSWPDLLVVSGGNESADGDVTLMDRLYLNNRQGGFTFSPASLPLLRFNKSCVQVADVDKDGDTDIFIGGLANAMKYGLPQDSYLLLNDGKGSFKAAEDARIKLKQLGMVTSASFADINNDGWSDLIVCGEWMPVKIFMNNKGNFSESDIEHSTGLWQSVHAADVNGDGFMDLIAGNWGNNSKLSAGKNGPLKLYVKDFDNNGSLEQVMCYTLAGKEYTFLAKDELERSLPVMKKSYLTYSEVAGKTVDYVFYDLFKDYTELKAEILNSSCFINDGKGNFKRIDLPVQAQLAPAMAISSYFANNKTNIIVGGNFYGVTPYEGRYDAMIPVIFSFDKKLNAFDNITSLPDVTGELRDIKWIKYNGETRIAIVAQNNGPLIFLQPLLK